MSEKEKEKQLIVRLPESMHAWLKENVKDQSINDLVVALIKAHIEGIQPETQTQSPKSESVEPRVEDSITENVKRLLVVREITMQRGYLNDGVGYKHNLLLDLEKEWLRDLNPQSMGMLEEYRGTFSEWIVEAYFEPLGNLSNDEKKALYHEIEKLNCEGDPNETIFKGVTRKVVYDSLRKDNEYTVMQVAGKLGIPYPDTYNKVVPWLKKNGFQIK